MGRSPSKKMRYDVDVQVQPSSHSISIAAPSTSTPTSTSTSYPHGNGHWQGSHYVNTEEQDDNIVDAAATGGIREYTYETKAAEPNVKMISLLARAPPATSSPGVHEAGVAFGGSGTFEFSPAFSPGFSPDFSAWDFLCNDDDGADETETQDYSLPPPYSYTPRGDPVIIPPRSISPAPAPKTKVQPPDAHFFFRTFTHTDAVSTSPSRTHLLTLLHQILSRAPTPPMSRWLNGTQLDWWIRCCIASPTAQGTPPLPLGLLHVAVEEGALGVRGVVHAPWPWGCAEKHWASGSVEPGRFWWEWRSSEAERPWSVLQQHQQGGHGVGVVVVPQFTVAHYVLVLIGVGSAGKEFYPWILDSLPTTTGGVDEKVADMLRHLIPPHIRRNTHAPGGGAGYVVHAIRHIPVRRQGGAWQCGFIVAGRVGRLVERWNGMGEGERGRWVRVLCCEGDANGDRVGDMGAPWEPGWGTEEEVRCLVGEMRGGVEGIERGGWYK